MKVLFSFLLLLTLASPVALAQKKISVEDFTTRPTFAQRTVTGINWMNDGKFYTTLDANKIVKYDVTTGLPVATLLDATTLPGKIEVEDYTMNADETKILLHTNIESIYRRSFTAEYFVYDTKTKSATQLSKGGPQSYAAFSPDGSKVAFVRKNNLFWTDLASMRETAVTDDGKFNHVINGTTDWVYEEEFSFVIGFYWSPDSKRLAYYKFDESAVREYNLQRWKKGQLYPEDYRFKYPKAGEQNSKVEIWVADLGAGTNVKADIGSETDIYIPRIKWTRDPATLSIRKLNRLQNRLDIIHTNASTGKSTTILTEQSPTYIDIEFIDDLTYLADGRQFIHSSESDGYKHFYLHSMNGTLIKQLTKGPFEASEFLGFDEKSKMIYYTSAEASPLEKHFYAVSLDGKKKTRLTTKPGSHSINLSPDFQFYIDHHSSASEPVVATLYQVKQNRAVKILETNEKLKEAISEFGLLTKEFFNFKTVDGTVLNGFFLKPKDFDPTRQYPVLLYQYSGPGSQNVSNAWGGNHMYFHQMLAQNGYLVALVDTRGTGFRGEAFKKVTYKQLGKYELEDIVATAKFLQGLDYVDDNRIGVWGWSYGGYMSSLAMTKAAGTFNLGIAVAPVTNWRFYDTVYTERFLQTPQQNAEGYDQNSPLTFASQLQGKFLLVHGTGDDNVHFQNSIVFQDALIEAGKDFQSFYYPDKTHSIAGGKTRLHLYKMMADFIYKNL